LILPGVMTVTVVGKTPCCSSSVASVSWPSSPSTSSTQIAEMLPVARPIFASAWRLHQTDLGRGLGRRDIEILHHDLDCRRLSRHGQRTRGNQSDNPL